MPNSLNCTKGTSYLLIRDIFNMALPVYILIDINNKPSSDGFLLATPSYRSRVTLGDRSFQVAAPALWNILPGEIRSITDLGIFKCHLKTHLFSEAFY